MNFYQNVLCTVAEISFSTILFQKTLLEVYKGCDNLPIRMRGLEQFSVLSDMSLGLLGSIVCFLEQLMWLYV